MRKYSNLRADNSSQYGKVPRLRLAQLWELAPQTIANDLIYQGQQTQTIIISDTDRHQFRVR